MAALAGRSIVVPQNEAEFHHCIDQLVPVREEWQTMKLRYLLECFEMLTDQAERLGFPDDFIHCQLRTLFKCLLPFRMQVELSFDLSAMPIEAHEHMFFFLDALTEALRKREMVEEDQKSNGIIRRHYRYNETPHGAVVCVFCERTDHPNYHCPLKFSQRVQAIRLKRLCFRCLRQGHLARHCHCDIVCRHCGLDHYNYMCKAVLLPLQGPAAHHYYYANNCQLDSPHSIYSGV